jgi:hypothetical protein
MKVREDHNIIIEKHPQFESLNKRLLRDMEEVDYPEELSHSEDYDFQGKHSPFETSSKTIDLINSWVMDLLKIRNSYLQDDGMRTFIYDNWFVRYNRGDRVGVHDHQPAFKSFVYFIKCPKGSSPLVFKTSGKRIRAEEGKLVVFPSLMSHYVSPNRCEDRAVLSGNVGVITTEMLEKIK